MGIESWSTTAAVNATTDGGANWAEGQAPSTVNNTARIDKASVRAAFNDLAWFQYGTGDQGSGHLATPCVYASVTSFTIAGADVTAAFHLGRRLRAVGSSTGTIYGIVTASSFSTNTTVSVDWDLGSLSNETLVISLSQIAVVGQPTPFPWYDARAYGVVGDGTTDDAVALQKFLDAIPSDGAGYLPAAPAGGYYKTTVALTKSGRFSLYGDGLQSKIHYTGSGVALTLSGPRFSLLRNLYITVTSSAAGGLYVRGAQEGYCEISVFVDGASAAGAYAKKFSSSWDQVILGGGGRQSTIGYLFDDTNYSVSAVNNNVTVIGSDCSACTTGVSFMQGVGANLIGIDCSGCTTMAEFGLGIAAAGSGGSLSAINVQGWYGETTDGFKIGRTANASASITHIDILPNNNIDATGDMFHAYLSDLVTVHEQRWGAGTCALESTASRTNWNTIQTVTDGSTTTSYQRNNNFLVTDIYARKPIQTASFTVAGLPSAATYIYGRTCVTDANATTFNAIVAGSGSNKVPVFSDGTNWRIG